MIADIVPTRQYNTVVADFCLFVIGLPYSLSLPHRAVAGHNLVCGRTGDYYNWDVTGAVAPARDGTCEAALVTCSS